MNQPFRYAIFLLSHMRHLLLILCLLFTAQFYAAEEAAKTLRGKAVLADVTNVISGTSVAYRSYDSSVQTELKTDENGEFEIPIKEYPVYVEVMTPDKNFGKVIIVQPTENEFVVPLELTASVHGKIIDSRGNKPSVGRTVIYSVFNSDDIKRYPWIFKRETKTNEKGEYEFCNLPTGVKCEISFPLHYYGEGENQFYTVVAFNLSPELQPNEEREHREISYDLRPDWNYECYFQMYNVYTMKKYAEQNRFERRFEVLLQRAKRDNKGVFVILVRDKMKAREDETYETLTNVYRTLFDLDDMFEQTGRFYMMCVAMQPENGPITPVMAEEFVKSRKIDLPLPALFSFAFFDADGKLRGVEPFDHTVSPLKRKQDLIEMLKKY